MQRSKYVNYSCLCGHKEFKVFQKHGIDVEECRSCGIIQQTTLPFLKDAEYINYYKNEYPPTRDSYITEEYIDVKQSADYEHKEKLSAYDHDLRLADMRCDAYGINDKSGKILDVGAGSGAFVSACRDRGKEAYGCEISHYAYAPENKYIYRKCLEDIYFPTDHFDMVTCHDVVEHVLKPKIFVGELFRATKQGGTCIIDFPRFFHESGVHHWKRYEHVWFFTTDQLRKLLEDIGFVVTGVKHPIPSKTVFYLNKPRQDRKKILVPPGMGDSFWSIIKLKSLIERDGIGIPDIYIQSPKDKKYDGHLRSFPFIEMFPFLHSTGKNLDCSQDPKLRRIWKEAYSRPGRTIIKDVPGFDYFVSYNGNLGHGTLMEELDPDLKTDWHPDMFVSLEQERYRGECENRYGKYFVLYFPFYGTYGHWTAEFPAECVAAFARLVKDNTGYTPLLVGSRWDADDKTQSNVLKDIPGCIDLRGKTSAEQIFGLIKGGEMVIGYPSGLTIMSTVFRQKTLIIWNNYYNERCVFNTCPPDTYNKTYFAEDTKGLLPHKLANRVISIMTGAVSNIKPLKVEEKYNINKNSNRVARSERRTKKTVKNVIPSVRDVGVINNVKGSPDITIMCVLKSGGDFDVEYVKRLKSMLLRHTTKPFDFVCLTDVNIPPEICRTIRLKHGYDRWWSKIEMFRRGLVKTKYILYFDLDSVILGNIDDFLLPRSAFTALKPWNETNRKQGLYASGMMCWLNGGAYSFLYDQFSQKHMNVYSRGDQEYISRKLKDKKKSADFFQDALPGIYSYKRNCRKALPEDARIVCFHGMPRPNNPALPQWVKDNWV